MAQFDKRMERGWFYLFIPLLQCGSYVWMLGCKFVQTLARDDVHSNNTATTNQPPQRRPASSSEPLPKFSTCYSHEFPAQRAPSISLVDRGSSKCVPMGCVRTT